MTARMRSCKTGGGGQMHLLLLSFISIPYDGLVCSHFSNAALTKNVITKSVMFNFISFNASLAFD